MTKVKDAKVYKFSAKDDAGASPVGPPARRAESRCRHGCYRYACPPRDIPDRDKWMEAIEAARTGHGGTSVAADLTISGLGYDVESPASKVVLPLLICTRTSTRTSMSKCSVPVRAPSD